MPISGPPIESGVVVIKGGLIEAVGSDIVVPEGLSVVDGTGKYVLPGFIDLHSHMGVYSWPGASAHSDGNEATEPMTPAVWAGDSFRWRIPL